MDQAFVMLAQLRCNGGPLVLEQRSRSGREQALDDHRLQQPLEVMGAERRVAARSRMGVSQRRAERYRVREQQRILVVDHLQQGPPPPAHVGHSQGIRIAVDEEHLGHAHRRPANRPEAVDRFRFEKDALARQVDRQELGPRRHDLQVTRIAIGRDLEHIVQVAEVRDFPDRNLGRLRQA